MGGPGGEPGTQVLLGGDQAGSWVVKLVGGEAGDKVKDWRMEEMAGGGASASECLLPR